MSNEFKHMIVEGLDFWYQKSQILFDNFKGQELNSFLHIESQKTNFEFDSEQKENIIVSLSNEINNGIQALCKAIKKLTDLNEHLTAAYLATNFFQGLTKYSERLKDDGRYVHACYYWLKILSYVYEGETRNDVQVHKGHPFYFLAFYYLLNGDIETGFIYAYNAIKEDEIIGKHCPEMGYPQKAPVYLTVFLVDNPMNRMIALVREFRNELNFHISSYNKEFKKNFKIQDFDKKFLQNESNINLKGTRYLFTFIFWSLKELKKKTKPQIQNNEFSKLRNLNWIFNLCLIIDKILEANSKIGCKSMGQNVEKLLTKYLNLLSQKDLERIKKECHWKQDPDEVLRFLFRTNSKIGSKEIPKVAIHYLVAWKLRNYGGHNIQQQKCIVENFEEIFQILMRCIISSVDLL